MEVARLTTVFDADTRALDRGFSHAEKSGRDFVKNVGRDFGSLAGGLGKLERGLSSLAGGFQVPTLGAGALAASMSSVVGIAVSLETAVVKSAFAFSDFAGKIHDMGQQSGLAAPTLSTIAAYARLTGVNVDQATSALEVYGRNLSQVAHGNKALAAEFERVGINAEKARELMRDPDNAARDLFDRLAGIANANERLDAANKLASKSGKVLASIALEMGGNFAEAQKAAREWGVVLTEQDVQAADKFGDAWEVLKMRAEGAIYDIGRGALPELEKAIGSVSGTLNNSGAAWQQFGREGGAALGELIGLAKQLGGALSTYLQYRREVKAILSSNTPGEAASKWQDVVLDVPEPGTFTRSAKALDAFKQNLAAKRQTFGGIGDVRGGGGGRGKKPKDLSNLYEQLGSAESSLRLAGLGFDVAKFKSGLDTEQSILDESLRAQLVSVKNYWGERGKLTLAGIDNEIDKLRSERAEAARAYSDKTAAIGADSKLGAKEQDLKLQIEAVRFQEQDLKLQGQIAEATERRGAALKLLPFQIAAANRELEKSMSGLKADFQEAGGDSVGAAYTRIADKFKEMHELARANKDLFPDADKWVTALERAEKLGANLARLGERADLGRGYLSLESAAIQDKITDGVFSEREGRRQVYELELQYKQVLEGILRESLAIAQARGDEKAVLAIKQQIQETERLAHVIDSARVKARGIFEGAATHGLDELTGGLKHAAATFGLDLANSIRRAANENIVKGLSQAIFGKTDEFGSDAGLAGKVLGKLGLGDLLGGGAQAASASVVTTANTTATELNTLAINQLTAAMSAERLGSVGDFERFFHPGDATIKEGRLSTVDDFEKFFNESNDNTGATASGIRDVSASVKAVDLSVNTQGMLTQNAIREQTQMMIALQPQAPGLLGTILSAAISGAVSGLTSGLGGGDSIGFNNEGPLQPRPTSPPVLKRAMGGPASGLTWVGERGPELVNLPFGSHVFNHNDSRRIVNNTHPREQTVRHTGYVEIREAPGHLYAPRSYTSRRSSQDVADAIRRLIIGR